MKPLAFALLAALAVPAASAQYGWPRDLEPQLRQAANAIYARGFRQQGTVVAAALEPGDYQDVNIDLGPGEYEVLVVCNTDCGDVDVALMGRRSRATARDGSVGDVATLRIERTEAGRIRLRVTMDVCLADACRFALAVFGR